MMKTVPFSFLMFALILTAQPAVYRLSSPSLCPLQPAPEPKMLQDMWFLSVWWSFFFYLIGNSKPDVNLLGDS